MTSHVLLVPYDPDWPRRFDEERRILAAVFAVAEAVVEHVGSTAVPGLGPKPVMDVTAGVPGFAAVEDAI
jgi:GrpB-like predicted nucleotidyltransferase (UPF0157 family)